MTLKFKLYPLRKVNCLVLGLVILSLFSCKNKSAVEKATVSEVKSAAAALNEKANTIDYQPKYDKSGNTQVFTNSLYKNKKYKILISSFSKEKSYFEGNYNSIFQVFELKSKGEKEIYRDSIQRHFDEVLFEDFTNDSIPEILIQNISDVRSNLTYYLYKIDTVTNQITKIKDFETIKNPHFLPKYNLIDNYVMSGRNWTSIYEIADDKVKDYGFVIEDGEDENGNYTYDYNYDKALKTILKERQKKAK